MCVGSVHSCAWHHSCAFWSRMKCVAELPRLSVTGILKFEIPQLVRKHKNLYLLYIITAPPPPQALDSSSVRELFPQVYVSFLDM